MKKLFLFLFIFPLVLNSCGSDEDTDNSPPPSLVGSSWSGTQGQTKVVIAFSQVDAVVITTVGSASAHSTQYSYVYDHPKVTLSPKQTGEPTMEATVSNNYTTMDLINTSTSAKVATLKRQADK